MRLGTAGTPTVSTGVQEESDFAFANNAVAFDAFSSKLYTDKPRAIIRELSCNAFDAHVAAGHPDKPFEIHLPTPHEPWFAINDYGTGLSHEDMKALFSLYFGSNKRDSDKFIGALGLGSKSPFCYDGNGGSFSVVSRHEGITRCYVASKTNGRPKLERMGDEMQTPAAPNGIEIKFAVDTKDIWEFENKAKLVFEFFDPLPAINLEKFEVARQKYVLKADKWGLRQEPRTTWGSGVRAIMGKVQYSVGDIDISRASHTQQRILQMPIDLFFEIGDLDFSISREALEMKPRTVNAILSAVDGVYEEFLKTVKEKIEACEHVWEARIMLYSLINQATGLGSLINDAVNSGKLFGKYKNFTYTERMPQVNESLYDHATVTRFSRNGRSSARSNKAKVIGIGQNMSADQVRDCRDRAKRDQSLSAPWKFSIDVQPDVHFVINDAKVPGDKYVHYYIQNASDNGGVKTVYLIHRREKESKPDQVVADGKKMLASIGQPPFLLMSELQKRYGVHVDPAAGEAPKRERREIVTLTDPGSRYRYTTVGWTKTWQKAGEPLPQGKKFYVAIDKLVAADTKFGDAWEFHSFVELVRSSGKFGLDHSTPVYGLKRGSKQIKNNDGEWVELMTHVFGRIKRIMTPQKTAQLSLYLKPFDESMYHDLLKHVAAEQPLSADSPVQSFALALAEADAHDGKNWTSFRKLLDLAQARGKYTPGQPTDFNKQWRAVKEFYPLLQAIAGYTKGFNTASVREPVLEYIRMWDEKMADEAAAKAAALQAQQQQLALAATASGGDNAASN
jgi:hypothetical protein